MPSNPMKFTHLHNHVSEASRLDALTTVKELIPHVKNLGMDAIGISDHGSLAAASDLLNGCKDAGIKPIIGIEFYCCPFGMSRMEKQTGGVSGKEHSYHLTAIALNSVGLRNLFVLSSDSYINGYYYKPRVDFSTLEKYNEGICILSGCVGGELSDLLLNDRDEEAEKLAAWFQRVFKNRYYGELQNNGLKIQAEALEKTERLMNRMGIPLVATSDCHYLLGGDYAKKTGEKKDEHWRYHDMLLCINTRSRLDDPNRMRFETQDFHVSSAQEMYRKFPKHAEAVKRSWDIAQSVEDNYETFGYGKRQFPSFETPPGKTVDQQLRELCEAGMYSRYGNPDKSIRDRLDWELNTVARMGFSSYFLIVHDIIRFCKEQGIIVNARGSAAGAIISYCLEISNICPIKYKLYFERFIDTNRLEPPDCDLDMDQSRRHEVINYIRQKYGDDHVAQIGTVGTLGARAVIKDVCRSLGIPLWRSEEISKHVPKGLHPTIEETAEVPQVAKWIREDPQVATLFDYAAKLQGLARNASTHAAGIVVTPKPTAELCPLQIITSKDRKGEILTQWDMKSVEKSGILKLDCLGLRNYSSLNKCLAMIKLRHGVDIDWKDLPDDDKKTFDLICSGECSGVFQLESGGMRELVKSLKPRSIPQISSVVSLYRPAAITNGFVDAYIKRKNGEEEVPSIHPIYDEILKDEFGVMTYQEDVMQILNRLGGVEMSRSYSVVKAISKKKHDDIEKNRGFFVSGAVANGLAEDVAQKIFSQIVLFAGYSFNRSHSAAYAYIAYVTAYLKANYPIEFMCSLLSSEMDGAERDKLLVPHVYDCQRMGIDVLPPDINHSSVEFAIEGNALRFGLLAIKGIGENVCRSIVQHRPRTGYTSLNQVFEKVPALDSGAAEALVRAGALDSLGKKRSQWLSTLKVAGKEAKTLAKRAASGQESLFDLLDEIPEIVLPEIPELPEPERLLDEKTLLGIYTSNHPLNYYEDILDRLSTHDITAIQELEAKAEIVVGCIINDIRILDFQKEDGPKRAAFLTVEDKTGVVQAILWPESYEKYGSVVAKDLVCFLRGKVDRRRDPAQLVVNQVLKLDDLDSITRAVLLKFDDASMIESTLKKTELHYGDKPVYVEINGVFPRVVYRTNYFVSATKELVNSLDGVKVQFTGSRGSGSRARVEDISKLKV